MGRFYFSSVPPPPMSSSRWPWRWHGIYGRGHLFPSFCLETKGPILRKSNTKSSSLELCWGKAKSAKLKIQGRHHGPDTQGERPSPMSARPTHPAQTRLGEPGLRTFFPVYFQGFATQWANTQHRQLFRVKSEDDGEPHQIEEAYIRTRRRAAGQRHLCHKLQVCHQILHQPPTVGIAAVAFIVEEQNLL